MKTAVSVPDDLFERAERVAARLKVSRSELYARALAAYLVEHEGDRIRQTIDHILRDRAPTVDEVLARMQSASLGADEGPLESWVDLGDRSRKHRTKRG